MKKIILPLLMISAVLYLTGCESDESGSATNPPQNQPQTPPAPPTQGGY
jgi:hypothetical protein